jgi:hypothetical protein
MEILTVLTRLYENIDCSYHRLLHRNTDMSYWTIRKYWQFLTYYREILTVLITLYENTILARLYGNNYSSHWTMEKY